MKNVRGEIAEHRITSLCEKEEEKRANARFNAHMHQVRRQGENKNG